MDLVLAHEDAEEELAEEIQRHVPDADRQLCSTLAERLVRGGVLWDSSPEPDITPLAFALRAIRMASNVLILEPLPWFIEKGAPWTR